MSTEVTARLSPDVSSALRQRIEARTATVGLVGLGYVGLPLLVIASSRGFPVVGVDIDQRRVDSLAHGRSYVVDVSEEDLSTLGPARFTTDASALRGADIIIIAVPTPLSDGVPDLSGVRQATADVAAFLVVAVIVIVTPGPDTALTIRNPLLGGRRSGVLTAVGVANSRAL